MAAKYRATYRNGKLFSEYVDGELTYLEPTYENAKRSDLPAPYVVCDIGEYRSPITNQMITSRSAHREHLKTHDVIEVGNERMPEASKASAITSKTDTVDIALAIKRRVEEVKQLSEDTYQQSVKVQQAEHAEVAALVTAT